MTTRVFILATCRKLELLPATTLVFNSLRTGFPNAEIIVHINGDAPPAVEDAARKLAAGISRRRVTHHEWIESLIALEDSPFWTSDTDVIFWEKVEHWGPMFKAPLAGRYIPGFQCEFTKAWTMPRLHTSLMYIDPIRVRDEIDGYTAGIPDTYFTPRPTLMNLVYPQFIPEKVAVEMGKYRVKNVFYDTCSLLHNAIFSQPFGEDQLDAYSHLNCGTIADIVSPHITDGKMQERHREIFENPELARGLWKGDIAYYDSRSTRE